jgi:hypothetical protein
VVDTIWNVYTDGKDEYDFLHAAAPYLGRYADGIAGLSADLFEQGWDTFTTLTRADYDPELFAGSKIDPSTLPETPRYFAAELGIDRFTRLRAAIAGMDPEEGDDFQGETQDIVEDLDRILAILEQAKQAGRRWYLDIEVH